jgi:hypothetical protein
MFRHSFQSLLMLSLCMVTGCSEVHSGPPTSGLSATAIPQATTTAATPDGFYAIRQAGSQAMVEVGATTSPFPISLPMTVVQGWLSIALLSKSISAAINICRIMKLLMLIIQGI